MDNIDRLAELLGTAIRAKNTQPYAAQYGRISGSTIILGNRAYPYDVAVDIPIDNGDWVYAVINQSGTKAVIIGR